MRDLRNGKMRKGKAPSSNFEIGAFALLTSC